MLRSVRPGGFILSNISIESTHPIKTSQYDWHEMFYLFISIIFLFVGPVLDPLLKRFPSLLAPLRWTVISVVAYLVLFHIIPESLKMAGASAYFYAFFGFVLLTALESLAWVRDLPLYKAALILSFCGLGIHTILDGLALFMGAHYLPDGTSFLSAIVLHRVPVGLFIWYCLKPKFGPSFTWGTLGLMILSTGLGFWGGSLFMDRYFLDPSAYQVIGFFQAFVGGAFLHILLDPILHNSFLHRSFGHRKKS